MHSQISTALIETSNIVSPSLFCILLQAFPDHNHNTAARPATSQPSSEPPMLPPTAALALEVLAAVAELLLAEVVAAEEVVAALAVPVEDPVEVPVEEGV